MNRPRRPSYPPARRRPSGPPSTSGGPGGPPRRRTALDSLPTDVEPKFKVLGTGVDRQALMGSAQPMEMAVIQLATREIEEGFQKFKGRNEDFWRLNPRFLEQARTLDEVLSIVQARRGGS